MNTESQQSLGSRKIIRRSAKFAQLGGVASGYALSMGHSIILTRITLVLIFFLSAGTAFIVYALAWMIMPSAATGPQGWEQPSVDDMQLARSDSDRVIAGVCGALANYFNMDSTLMRLIVILLALLGGIGLMTYLYAWMILPKK